MTDSPSVWSAHLIDGLEPPAAGLAAEGYRDDSGWNVYVHNEFFEWLEDPKEDVDLRKRARYCLTELITSGGCARRKNVQGEAKGWVRTQLGGTGGSHYYLWWAPFGYPAVSETDLEPKSVLVRLVRHHDDTSKSLHPGTKEEWFLLKASDILRPEDTELSEDQQKVVALDGKPVRLVKGIPGSGKTTSLHKAASSVWGDKVLYLTYSSDLAGEADRYFTAFAPVGTSVRSMTFGMLLEELGATGKGLTSPLPLAELIHKFEERTKKLRPSLGKWQKRPAELYAELHAYAFGMALPVEFRGLPGASTNYFDSKAYLELRKSSLSKKVASAALEAARYVEKNDYFDELFPLVAASRRLLDDSCADLPDDFVGYSAVMIDEVQDLTVVEAMLVLSVVGRIGRQTGQMPQLFVAGDEAQTVRPTAFDWGWFGDLLTLTLGGAAAERDDITLSTNMRSPRSVASLIEATRTHYKLLHKDERPGDLTYVQPDVDREGKVLYCHAPGEDLWQSVVALFGEQLSAQLVYPGMTVPSDLHGSGVDIATADQVKGLGFDLVGVVDAGQRQVELVELSEKVHEDDDKMASSLGRVMADQFRVAVSRSQENLVLLDRGDEDRGDAIHQLVAEVDPDLVVRVDVEGLASHLEEDVLAIDLLQSQLDDARQILGKDPVWALTKAQSAVDLIPKARAEGEVPDPLVNDVYRVAGLAAIQAANVSDALGKASEADERRRKAAEYLGSCGLGELYLTVTALHNEVEDGLANVAPGTVLRAARAYPEVAAELNDLAAPLALDLSAWLAQVAADGLPYGGDLSVSIEAAATAALVFERRQPETVALGEQALRRTAELAVEATDFERALVCLESVEDADVDLVAQCFEGAGLWAEAIEHYEINDRPLDALRCARAGGDFDRALKLARNVAPEQVGRIRWAQRLVEMVAPELTDHGAPLSDAERRELLTILDQGLLRAMGSVPGDDDLVDTMWDQPAPVPEIPVDLTQPLDPYVPPVFEGSEIRSDFSDEAELGQIESLAEPAASEEDLPVEEPVSDEAPAEVPEPKEFDAPAAGDDEIPAAQPFGSEAAPPSAPVEDGFVSLADLSAEVGRSESELKELCAKLGIAVVSVDGTVTDAQADRIRGRVARENKG